MDTYFPEHTDETSLFPEKQGSLSDFIKEGLAKNIYSHLNESIGSMYPGKIAKGAAEGSLGSLYSSARGIGGLMGHNLPNIKMPETDSRLQNIGRLIGSTVQTGLQMAPLALGAEAAAPAIIPGIVSRGLGSAAYGALSEPENRGASAINYGLGSAAVELTPGVAKLIGKKYSAAKILDNPDKLAIKIQSAFEQKNNALGNQFENIQKTAEDRNVANLKLDKSFYKDVAERMDKKQSTKALIEKAKKGDFPSLRKLQSEMRYRSDKLNKSLSIADQDYGAELGELRTNLNKKISEHLRDQGHTDLADQLKDTMRDYRKLMETYMRDPKVARLVGPNQEVPKDFLGMLSKKSKAMDAFRAEHPEIKEALKLKKEKENVQKTLKRAAWIMAMLKGSEFLNRPDERE